MTQASIEARNNAIDDSLTIDGNLSGDFMFGADFDGSGSDQLIITGDVADGSSMSVVLNPTEQLSGETTFTVITVDGENNADAPVIAGVTGNFADSLLGAEVNYSEETGEVNVTARFGMGHMATSAIRGDHHGAELVDAVDRQLRQAQPAAARGAGRRRRVRVGHGVPGRRFGRALQ